MCILSVLDEIVQLTIDKLLREWISGSPANAEMNKMKYL